jgi:protein-S-isoprenylcysteine O-methyltransferase Ste14
MKNAIQILITGMVSLAIQFGLAIAGWGGWNAFFAHRPFQALAWVCVALVVLAMFSGSSGLSSGQEEDSKNRWVLAAFMGIALAAAYFSSFTDRIGFWTLDGNAMRWTGVVVCGAGGLLRLIPVFVLRRRFSGLVAIQEGHTLETRGIYGFVRNPSYLGMMVTAVGWAMAFRSVVGIILAFAQLIPLVARIRSEERILRQHFGSEYEEYCARTWRLLPGIY